MTAAKDDPSTETTATSAGVLAWQVQTYRGWVRNTAEERL